MLSARVSTSIAATGSRSPAWYQLMSIRAGISLLVVYPCLSPITPKMSSHKCVQYAQGFIPLTATDLSCSVRNSLKTASAVGAVRSDGRKASGAKKWEELSEVHSGSSDIMSLAISWKALWLVPNDAASPVSESQYSSLNLS